jgi:heptosyltransferase-2
MKRFLVIQTAFLGDVVLTTPLIAELRRSFPGGRISVLCGPVGAEVLGGHPAVDEIIPFAKRDEDRGALGMLRLVRRIRSARFDVGVAAHRSHRTGLLLRLGAVPIRIGFSGAPGAWVYTDTVPWSDEAHAVRRYLALARPAGGDPSGADPAPILAVGRRADERVGQMLREEGIDLSRAFITVAPGSVWATKRWTAEGFAAVVRGARERGYQTVVSGAPGERELCDRVAQAAGKPVAVLAGRTGVAEMVALLARSRLLVGNDSGPGHVASAVGTPVVTVFGPTAPSFGYVPFGEAVRAVGLSGLECRPCHHHGPPACPLDHFRCMRELDPGEILREMDDLLVASSDSRGSST